MQRPARRLLVCFSAVASILVTTLVASPSAFAAQDPGVRGGAAGAGGPIAGLTANQVTFFNDGKADFASAEDLADGLGPRFNLDSCGGCHAQPATGGTSPATNPQVAVATLNGAKNTIPSFVTANGPVREARFPKVPGTNNDDGGVHALFVISGRVDPGGANATGCTIVQDDFATQVNNNNIIFRIPTPVFGMGLVEEITDAALVANAQAAGNANGKTKADLGISAKLNRNGNDGTVTRFGWKAQNKSGLIFAGEAYNVEMGISNELFTQEREENANCQFANVPNDIQDTNSINAGTTKDAALGATPAVLKFANFQRFSAPPTPVTSYTSSVVGAVSSASISAGRTVFNNIGCALCHTPTLTTNPKASVAALRNKPVNAFSDFAVHDMGPRLADEVAQGNAEKDEFRTAPLWGLGQRIFFLHDGRTRNLDTAIREHFSVANGVHESSEANDVIVNYVNLSDADQQNLLNFLRSL